MTPQTQKYLLEDGPTGDCTRAAVASLLDLPLEAAPHFTSDQVQNAHIEIDGWYSQPWVTAMHTWAFLLGYDVERYGEHGLWDWDEVAQGHVLAGGPSPRDPEGTLHSVVWGPDGLAHDPHPSRDGLAGEPVDYTAFYWRDDAVR